MHHKVCSEPRLWKLSEQSKGCKRYCHTARRLQVGNRDALRVLLISALEGETVSEDSNGWFRVHPNTFNRLTGISEEGQPCVLDLYIRTLVMFKHIEAFLSAQVTYQRSSSV